MTNSSLYAYCPYCRVTRELKRKDFDVCLSIILLLFTGVGFFIYLIYYYTRPKDRCSVCSTKIPRQMIKSNLQELEEMKNRKMDSNKKRNESKIQEGSNQEMIPIKGDNKYFCEFCGAEIKEGIKFCPSCGSKI
ncbi:MAG: zinc ribbon domain-containing protein [Promethearchaeota archaeon]|nr:MAG: zinc ribbon domain-containing protein [Candidatus Lokiarchaeota archaeon]